MPDLIYEQPGPDGAVETHYPYTCTRDAVGYFGGPDGMTTYAADTIRTTDVLSVSECNAVEPVDEDPRGAYGITPHCINSNGLFATSNHTNKAYLFLSADGVTGWTQKYDFGYASGYDVDAVHVTSTGRLIAWVDEGSGHVVYYSTGTHDGTAWTKATNTVGGGDVVFTYDPHVWGFHEDHGTIIASTYGLSTNDTEIWRSTDDGLTWTKVLTVPSGTRDHFHTVCYHSGLSRWVIDGGDDWTGEEQITMFSDDDGVTWYNPIDPKLHSVTGRVTRFRDYGHPTRILVGSDHHLRIGWFDLDTLETGTFCRFPSSWDHAYAFDLFQHNGIWYWCSDDAIAGNGYAPVIRVSTDLVNWVTYWRPTRTDLQTVYQFCGELNGKLHFRVRDTDSTTHLIDEHIYLDPARIVKRTGVVVSPAKENLLGDRPSKCDLYTDWSLIQSGTYTTSEVDTSVSFAPEAVGALHLVKDDVAYSEYTGVAAVANATTVIGERYVVHAWVKGKGFFAKCYMSPDASSSASYMHALNQDGWTEVWSAPFVATSTANHPVILIAQDQADYSSDVYIGACELLACKDVGEWSPGGVSQPADVASVTMELGTHWTQVFGFMPLQDSDELTNSDDDLVYIHSWVAPDGDFVNLYFDPSDSKIKMESTVDASPTGSPIETTGTRQIDREHLFRIAVRYANGEMSFSVSDGAGVEHVDPITHSGDALSGAGIVITTGDESGENSINGVLLDNRIIEGVLSESQVESYFDLPNFKRLITTQDRETVI